MSLVKKKSITTLNKKKKDKEKTVLVTSYDYPQAVISENAGVDAILVGDSLGMTTLGYDSTLPVTMDDMISHSRAVARGAKAPFLIGDMPFLSYQVSNSEAINNAGKFLKAGMDCIKLEGEMVDRIKSISEAGIMVMGHLGLTPQTKAKLGGYKVQGKSIESVKIILDQALRIQDAGCSLLLLEAMPSEPAGLIAKELDIPVYGIGAGNKVDGQLVIFHDLVGMFWEFKSKFVKQYCEAGKLIQNAIEDYGKEVRENKFPFEENCYEMVDEDLKEFLKKESKK